MVIPVGIPAPTMLSPTTFTAKTSGQSRERAHVERPSI
jgi:hypothetical protein